MFFAHPEGDQLFGVTVKDSDTCGYTFYIYRCSVKDFECVVSFITVIYHQTLSLCLLSKYYLPTCIDLFLYDVPCVTNSFIDFLPILQLLLLS